MSEHRVDTGSRFIRLVLTPEEDRLACQQAGPLLLAFLQNKIAAYAEQLIVEKLDIDPNPANQMKTIMRLVELRAQVEVLEELRDELIDGQQVADGN